MSWMSILAEKTKTPRKRQKKHNLRKTKRILNIKMTGKGGPVFTFSLAGGWLAPCPCVSYAIDPSSVTKKGTGTL